MNPSILYTRVTSREQEEEGFSLDAQLKAITGYAERNGFTTTKRTARSTRGYGCASRPNGAPKSKRLRSR